MAVNFYKEGAEAGYFLGIGLITCIVGMAVCFSHKAISVKMLMGKKESV